MINRPVLDALCAERAGATGSDPRFRDIFLTKWLPKAGVVTTATAQVNLYAPLYPEVYVFGPRIFNAINSVTNTVRLVEDGANVEQQVAFVADLRRTYQDDFGDINDYDWAIYQRYVRRNRLTFTSRVERVYDDLLPQHETPSALMSDNPSQPSFAIMLQEMLYFELFGPGMQKLNTAWLHKGAKRHAAFLQKWALRRPVL